MTECLNLGKQNEKFNQFIIQFCLQITFNYNKKILGDGNGSSSNYN